MTKCILHVLDNGCSKSSQHVGPSHCEGILRTGSVNSDPGTGLFTKLKYNFRNQGSKKIKKIFILIFFGKIKIFGIWMAGWQCSKQERAWQYLMHRRSHLKRSSSNLEIHRNAIFLVKIVSGRPSYQSFVRQFVAAAAWLSSPYLTWSFLLSKALERSSATAIGRINLMRS